MSIVFLPFEYLRDQCVLMSDRQREVSHLPGHLKETGGGRGNKEEEKMKEEEG